MRWFIKSVKVKLKGITPLLHHRMPDENLLLLLGTKIKKKKDKEVLTPREIAGKHAYVGNDGIYYIPSEFVTGAMSCVSSEYKQNNSVRKSLKSVIKGAVSPQSINFSLFKDESCLVPIIDFEVDIKKGTNHQRGAVAICRPRFDQWFVQFNLLVDTDIISIEMLKDVLEDSGKRAGVGSFRVSKGGIYGKFQVIEFLEDN